MKNKRFLIFDTEEGYADKLAAALSREGLDYQFRSFSDPVRLTEALRGERAEIVLAGMEGMGEEEQRRFSEELANGSRHLFFLGSGREGTGGGVGKYQSCRQIFRAVMADIHEETKEQAEKTRENAWRFGIFSPLGGCGKTLLSRQLAELFSEKESTLLIGMETFSGEAVREGGDFADGAYYFRQKKLEEEIWQKLRRKEGLLEVIGPPLNPEDMEEFARKELLELWEKMASFGYQKVVMDVGSRFPVIEAAFAWCDVILAPEGEDVTGKWEHFTRFARGTGRTGWEQKIWRVTPEERLAFNGPEGRNAFMRALQAREGKENAEQVPGEGAGEDRSLRRPFR